MSQASIPRPAPCDVTAEEAEAALERIAHARNIGSSPALLSFLRYVVRETLKGEGAKLKAYTIGVGALGKPDAFDPVSDSSVRVTAGRLRRELEAYYADAGAGDPIEIVLSRGSYVPMLRRRARMGMIGGTPATPAAPDAPPLALTAESAPSAESPPSAAAVPAAEILAAGAAPQSSQRPRWHIVAAMAGAVVLIGTALSFVASQPQRERASEAAPDSVAMRTVPSLSIEPFEVAGVERPGAISASRLRRSIIDAAARYDGLNLLLPSDGNPLPPALRTRVEYRLLGRIEYQPDGSATLAIQVVYAPDGTEVWARTYPAAAPGAPPAADAELELTRELATTVLGPFGAIWTREIAMRADRNPARLCMIRAVEYWRVFEVHRHEEVRSCLGQLLAESPHYAPALFGLGFVALRDHYLGRQAGSAAPLDQAFAYAVRGVEARPQSARAQQLMSAVRFARGEISEGLAAAETAVELNPYDVYSIAEYGQRLISFGQYERGTRMLRDVAAPAPVWNAPLGAYLVLGSYLAGDMAGVARDAPRAPNDDSPLGLIARIAIAEATDDPRLAYAATDRLATVYHGDMRTLVARFFPAVEAQDALLDLLARPAALARGAR
jgi:hypothetical protein